VSEEASENMTSFYIRMGREIFAIGQVRSMVSFMLYKISAVSVHTTIDFGDVKNYYGGTLQYAADSELATSCTAVRYMLTSCSPHLDSRHHDVP